MSAGGAVDEYLAALPPERRIAVEAVRATIVENLPEGYEEAVDYGMIVYRVPLEKYPNTYNGQPLMYAALASQKRYFSLYLTAVYADEDARARFVDAYRRSGRPLDMGKSCVRFRRLEDLPLDVVGDAIGSVGMEAFIVRAKAVRAQRRADR